MESAANYRQKVEEQKRSGTEERIRKTDERFAFYVVFYNRNGIQSILLKLFFSSL